MCQELFTHVDPVFEFSPLVGMHCPGHLELHVNHETSLVDAT